jgi:penicillin-binding protein 1A
LALLSDPVSSGGPTRRRFAKVLDDDDLSPDLLEPAAAPPPPPRRSHRALKRWIYLTLGLLALLFLYLLVTAPLSKSLQPIAAPGITLLSAEGKPIARRGAVTDQPVSVAELPPHVAAAFVAIEDRRFYDHSGIDPWGIFRAAFVNLKEGGVVEGGSTITQQLAKLAFLSSDRTYARKLQEFLLAFWLEGWLTKDEILSRYLSSVYFGDNIYGLRAAANHYFSRSPEKLTIEQSAMLAGLMKAPSRLAPTVNLKGARQRGDVVEAAMVDAGFLTEEEARKLPRVKLKRGPVKDVPTGTYFADWVFPDARAFAQAGYGEQRIVTTLEDDLQRHAVNAVRSAGLGPAQVALVAMRADGRVVAMIGGKSYKSSPFNRATQAKRQPGSAFKLFVYLAALRAGLTPASMIEDEPLTIGDWTPKNYGNQYRGLITLRDAFAVSSNVAAVRLSERVGRQNVIRAARDLGVTAELDNQRSLPLGTSTMSLMDLVEAYAAVAAGHYPVQARGLPEVEQSWYDRMMSRRSQMGENTRAQMLELLSAAVNGGTGRAAALPYASFGKTGTTQDSRDAVFVGFAGDLITGVWVGNDNNKPLGKSVTGGTVPAQIWKAFMARAVNPRTGQVAPPPPPPPEQVLTPQGGIFPGNVTVPIGDSGYDVGINIGPDDVTFSAGPNGEETVTTVDAPPPDEPAPEDLPTLAPPPQTLGPEDEVVEDERAF